LDQPAARDNSMTGSERQDHLSQDNLDKTIWQRRQRVSGRQARGVHPYNTSAGTDAIRVEAGVTMDHVSGTMSLDDVLRPSLVSIERRP
jgi:hypothetical protein